MHTYVHSSTTTSSTLSSPLLRIQSDPLPSFSSNDSFGCSIADSTNCESVFVRRGSEPPTDSNRGQSPGSMTSWGSTSDMMEQDNLHLAPTSPNSLPQHSPHEVTTPESDRNDRFANYFIQRNGDLSPASSTTTTAFGGVTPRAELPAPVWPRSTPSPTHCNDSHVDMEERIWQKNDCTRSKHASLDTSSMRSLPTYSPPVENATERGLHAPASCQPDDSHRRLSEPAAQHRVVAQSSMTGCRISAPMSPPAHYPGSAGQRSRRASSSRTSTDTSDSTSMSSSSSASSYSACGQPRTTPPAPRWAHPPRHTNKISGRAWSFSQGQERPDLDFDPELFDQAEPDAVQEILKGMEGRIAVKTTPIEYNIMAWLPGFSIDDITISMKGDRTVQIVADLWDEGDHAQWNVLLGEDVNKSAISAKLEGSELRVTVKRKQVPTHRPLRSTFSSWSGPATAITPPHIAASLTSTSGRPGLATYPRPPQISH